MTDRLAAWARGKREAAAILAKLSTPGEFIHLDGRTPRLASGGLVPRRVLKALEADGAVVIVNRDLFNERPIQFAAPRFQCPPLARNGNGHAWSTERRAEALSLWLTGKTKADVARHFHTSRGFIVRMARADRWPVHR